MTARIAPTTDPFALPDVPAAARWLVRRVLALPDLRRLYDTACAGDGMERRRGNLPFDQRVLRALDVDVAVTPGDVTRIPSTGPVVVAANHPHGILDGLIATSVVGRVRSDVRVLTNFLLARIPELHDSCFFVNPFDDRRAARSVAGLRAARRWLRNGGVLIVFPAGEVAHGPISGGTHGESRWHSTAERLAQAANAPIVRLHISGTNSRLFYAVGCVHRSLRTALLPRELLNKRGSRIAASIVSESAIASEIAALNGGERLIEAGRFQVYCTSADRIPATLAEIGRLRELAYRAVGEGTGGDVDLDRFDQHYRHLFLWDRGRQQVAGAYRLGPTDEIVAAYGLDGLYTRTLFQFDADLLERLGGPALELGRAWVHPEYQKDYNALLMLWKGIGRFVTEHPRYRRLFGPVSISARYSDVSQRLLLAFLAQNHLDRDLAARVTAVHGVRVPGGQPAPLPPPAPDTIGEVNRLVAAAEPDGKGVPVLLRQYLKLNARAIAFNTDPAFGDALDALMMVDLASVRSNILCRYLGVAGAAAFLRGMSSTPASAA